MIIKRNNLANVNNLLFQSLPQKIKEENIVFNGFEKVDEDCLLDISDFLNNDLIELVGKSKVISVDCADFSSNSWELLIKTINKEGKKEKIKVTDRYPNKKPIISEC